MNLSTATQTYKTAAMSARTARAGRKSRRDPAAGVNAFADRLLYDGWLEDNRRDRMKLVMIRAIVEWAQSDGRD
ncbi:MAG TPA: hypothetical protein VLD36_15770 [Burkholderiales bacterium]|nr:hypothetical protein [Burkholderiales bacterium]